MLPAKTKKDQVIILELADKSFLVLIFFVVIVAKKGRSNDWVSIHEQVWQRFPGTHGRNNAKKNTLRLSNPQTIFQRYNTDIIKIGKCLFANNMRH